MPRWVSSKINASLIRATLASLRSCFGPSVVRVGGDNNPIASDLGVKRKKSAAAAGPAGAFTGIRFVKGAMGTTGQKSAIVAEKLVRPPVERCSGMDAIVDVSVVAPAKVHHETFDKPLPPENVKFRGAAGRDFAQRRRPHSWRSR